MGCSFVWSTSRSHLYTSRMLPQHFIIHGHRAQQCQATDSILRVQSQALNPNELGGEGLTAGRSSCRLGKECFQEGFSFVFVHSRLVLQFSYRSRLSTASFLRSIIHPSWPVSPWVYPTPQHLSHGSSPSIQ